MSKAKPNIILCAFDQLRAFEVGCYGNAVVRTPNIDRLAAEGVRFETAVSNDPVCMPARSIMLAGQYCRTCCGTLNNFHYRHSDGWVLPHYPYHGRPHLKSPTLPEQLRAIGYHTAAIGKWHIHSWPQDVGFDTYVIPRVPHCHTGQNFCRDGGLEFVAPGYSVDFESREVRTFLQAQSRAAEPFFLFYNISPPHPPLADAPEKYLKMFDPKDIVLRPNTTVSGKVATDPHWFGIYRWDYRYLDYQLPHTRVLPDGFDLRSLIALYYGATAWADDALGRLLAGLRETGLDNNTLIVFTSDHGDNLGSHGRWNKNTLNEEATRIPLIVRWPGALPAGKKTDRVASLVDVMPTILELAGGEIPSTVQGRSLARALRGPAAAAEDNFAFIETSHDGIGIRTPTHSYGLPWKPAPPTIGEQPHRFFDLRNDPYELNNLAGTGEQSDLARQLSERLIAWHETTPWMPVVPAK